MERVKVRFSNEMRGALNWHLYDVLNKSEIAQGLFTAGNQIKLVRDAHAKLVKQRKENVASHPYGFSKEEAWALRKVINHALSNKHIAAEQVAALKDAREVISEAEKYI